MKNLITTLLVLVSTLSFSQEKKMRTMDTIEKNSFNIERLGETNDCTVRAISEGFNIPYLESLKIMKELGREYAQGIPLNKYVRGLSKRFFDEIIFGENLDTPLLPKDFINEIAEEGFTYIVISHAHTFVIEEHGTKMRWYVKGNYDDKDKEILMYVKVENKYKG